MSKVLPADCDHPEESLGPLPYCAGRPPRADEWECGVCGMWQVAEEPKYRRRPVKAPVEAGPPTSGRHTHDCAYRQTQEPMHIGSPSSGTMCICLCHASLPFSSGAWGPPLAPTPSPIRGTGYLGSSAVATETIGRLVAEGKLHSMNVTMEHPPMSVHRFIKPEPPGVVITANNVLADAAVEVMGAMFELVRGRGTRLVWEMSRAMLHELTQRSSQLYSVWSPMPTPPVAPTVFGGEIRVLDGIPHSDITLRVR